MVYHLYLNKKKEKKKKGKSSQTDLECRLSSQIPQHRSLKYKMYI